jgi:hypothetical protein
MPTQQAEETVAALVIFSAPLLKTLSTARLPPSYVGVRRCRPSNKAVQSAWRKSTDATSPRVQQESQVAFIVKDEHGNERRMTNQEKKEVKRKLKVEKRETQRKRKAECLAKDTGEKVTKDITKDSNHTETNSSEAELVSSTETEQRDSNYHQLKVNSAAVEEELADLRGDRDGVPPVALMPCMALQSHRVGIASPEPVPPYAVDDELAHTWATQLKESFKEAEEVRDREDMRTMAYQLVPEAWTRMRPDTLVEKEATLPVSELASSSIDKTQWSWVPVRPRLNPRDSDLAIVCAVLHSHSKDLRISCGSKFGCDLLLYDGPRDERHAFAGLRILSAERLPRSYDLHGYVRCLNTAGKLSLLAKVDRSEDGSAARVAFVDLALEKILTAPRHAKRSVKQARRDISKNLAKK